MSRDYVRYGKQAKKSLRLTTDRVMAGGHGQEEYRTGYTHGR